MLKDKMSKYLIGGGMALVGLVAGIAGIAGAQQSTIAPNTSTSSTVSAPTNGTTSTQTVDTPEAGDVADSTNTPETHKHAPLGGDGVVSSVNGTTIVVSEEADEGGASYTVDASKATVTVNGTAGSLSDIKVGQKVFVQGTTSGTNVSATSISIGHDGGKDEQVGHTDGNGADDAAEAAAGTPETSGK